jgi:hypothetical protein
MRPLQDKPEFNDVRRIRKGVVRTTRKNLHAESAIVFVAQRDYRWAVGRSVYLLDQRKSAV